MKNKISYTLLTLLFLSFTFNSMPPPGWYQQTLPVNDFVNDIFFIDSLNGWVVTEGHTNNNDTGYIMKTTDGGDNWVVKYARNVNLTAVQFVNSQTGYVGGGSGTGTVFMYKTTNGGDNWIQIIGTTGGTVVTDINFIDSDIGWYCDDGVRKTTNGGISWITQLNTGYRIHFINADTGWVGTDYPNNLYRTTNGGTNWNLQYTFPNQINDIYFFNGNVGIETSGVNRRTTDGGFTWTTSNEGGIKISFVNDSIGWAGSNFLNIMKSTDNGIIWGRQTSPSFDNSSVSGIDSLTAWAGGNGVVHTTDGGGPITNIQQVSNEIPSEFELYQNYPNPFNPTTVIKFKVKSTKLINLTVYNTQGKEISTLVNEKLNPGEYEYTFDGSKLPSGVYFYRIAIYPDKLKKDSKIIDTKKMLLIK